MKALLLAGLHALLPTPSSAQDSSLLDSQTRHHLGAGLSFGSTDHSRDDPWTAARPDGHAPIGVMGDHVHETGEWMVSVRLMHMNMTGMREGTDNLSSAEVLSQGFMVTPTEMDMDMLMLGGMYAFHEKWTGTVMIPYLSNSMDHVTGMGGRFTTDSEGLGDVQIGGLRALHDADGQRVHANLSVSLPTGSTDERDDTPAMANAKLPYPMQLGTGTFDLLPGLTYLGQKGDTSWGAQAQLRFHTGENDEGYTVGDRQNVTTWMARRFGRYSVSLRLAYSHWDDYSGQDDDLNPNMVPTADPDLRGGQRLDVFAGVNWYPTPGGSRFALEVGSPAWQDLNGPQLETDLMVSLGWQLAR